MRAQHGMSSSGINKPSAIVTIFQNGLQSNLRLQYTSTFIFTLVEPDIYAVPEGGKLPDLTLGAITG